MVSSSRRSRTEPWGFRAAGDGRPHFLPDRRSANHGGRGQNVLFEDGRCFFVTDMRVVPGGDDPWRNDDGFAEAGTAVDDSVVLPSGMRPIVDLLGPPVAADAESRPVVAGSASL